MRIALAVVVMRLVVRVLGGVCVVAISLGARADIRFTPAAPTAADVISAEVDLIGSCEVSSSTVVMGNVVRTTFTLTGCHPIPISTPATVQFGPLAAGTYTYEAYQRVEGGPLEPLGSAPLVIGAAPGAASIPVLESRMLFALAIGLAGVAGVVGRER